MKNTDVNYVTNKIEPKNEENTKQVMEKQNNIQKEKALLNNYQLKDNFENQSLTQKNSRLKNRVNFFNNNLNFSGV